MNIYISVIISISSLLIITYAINKLFSKTKTQTTQKPKIKKLKYSPKFDSNSQISKSLSQINVDGTDIPFSMWYKLDKQLNNKYERELALYYLEKLIEYITNEKRIKKVINKKNYIEKRKKELKKKHKRNPRLLHKKINELYVKNNDKMQESDKPMMSFINIDNMFNNFDVKSFTLEKELKKELKLKHIASLWDLLNDRVIQRDSICIICQYDINDDTFIKLNCCEIEIHYDCLLNYISSKTDLAGEKINLNELGCLICKNTMNHKHINNELEPLNNLYNKILEKYKKRLKFDGFDENKIDYARNKYIYYICYKCNEPYYNGINICHEQRRDNIPKEKRLCSKCDDVKGYEKNCKIHGNTFIQWKCKFCCSVATWDCGCTHFCELCHVKAGELWDTAKDKLLQCPCVADKKTNLPKKIDLDICPLGVAHPPHGEEYCLGCAECRRIANETNDNESDTKEESKEDSNIVVNDKDSDDDINDEKKIIEYEINNENDIVSDYDEQEKESSIPPPNIFNNNMDDSNDNGAAGLFGDNIDDSSSEEDTEDYDSSIE